MASEPGDDGASLRSARASDLDAVACLTEDAYAPYTAMLGSPPLPVTEDCAPRIAAGEVCLLETSPGELVGLLVLERHADHALIYRVAVAPQRQGRGYGSALLRAAESKARPWNLPELRLYTNTRMERNIAIYAAAGYRETARRPHPVRPGWSVVDMVKPLG